MLGSANVPDHVQPLVSVVVVTLNNAPGLERTLQSIVRQTYQPIELIVIDGGSTDDTHRLFERFERQINRWLSEADEGIYEAMNKGIGLAQGQWLVFMNAGDCFDRDDSLAAAMAHSRDADLIYSDARFILAGRERIAVCSFERLRIIHQALVYRRQLHERYGAYVSAPGMTISDYLFFVSVSRRRWVKCDTIIACCDASGVSSKPAHYQQKLAVDLITGRRGSTTTALMLLTYPLYRLLLRPFVRRLRSGRI